MVDYGALRLCREFLPFLKSVFAAPALSVGVTPAKTHGSNMGWRGVSTKANRWFRLRYNHHAHDAFSRTCLKFEAIRGVQFIRSDP